MERRGWAWHPRVEEAGLQEAGSRGQDTERTPGLQHLVLLLCGLADNLNRKRRPIYPLLAEKSLTANCSTSRQQGPRTPIQGGKPPSWGKTPDCHTPPLLLRTRGGSPLTSPSRVSMVLIITVFLVWTSEPLCSGLVSVIDPPHAQPSQVYT